MEWAEIEGKWEQIKGRVRQNWAKLTDDDLERIRGRRDELAGILKERYGYAKEQADREIDEFLNRSA